MKTIVYIHSWEGVNAELFLEQLILYNALGEVLCIDESQDQERIESFLSLAEHVPMDNCSYTINDIPLGVANAINPHLQEENVLVVSNKVMLPTASIDEMRRVLWKAERHLFVIPRSDGGDRQRFPGSSEVVDVCEKLEWMKKYLPEQMIVPCTYGECVMLKGRKLFGHIYADSRRRLKCGMDQRIESLSVALLAFSLELNDYGYNTICANHAYAMGVESVFDMMGPSDFKLFKEELLTNYKQMVLKCESSYCLPIEKFGVCIGKKKQKRKLLYYMVNLGGYINGSSVHALGVLAGIVRTISFDRWDVTVVTVPEAAKFHGLETNEKYRVVSPEQIDGVYDVGLVPFHSCNRAHQRILNASCSKLVFWPLDLIALRSNYLCDVDYARGYEFIAKFADGLLFFSDSVKNDFEAYFGHVPNVEKVVKKVSYILPAEKEEEKCLEEMPFEEFYLVMGNGYLHKMIAPLMLLVQERQGDNFVVFGGDETGKASDNVMMVKSGNVSEQYVQKLYSSCKGLIYPSVYEGFGLPTIQALCEGKNVALMNTDVNRELECLEPSFSERMFYMDSIYDLPSVLDAMEQGTEKAKCFYHRKWEDVGCDCIEVIERVAEEPFDQMKMVARRDYLN